MLRSVEQGGDRSLRVHGENVRIEVFVLPPLSQGSMERGRRRVVLSLDVAGLAGRYDALAAADVADRLRSSMDDWDAGLDALLELPAGRTLALTRREGSVYGVLSFNGSAGPAVSLDFRLTA